MIPFKSPWQSYRRVAMETAPSGQLVLMLFDGALRFLEQSLQGFAREDDPLEYNRTFNNNVQRAQAILHELNDCLDMERGGELSATMRALYDYMDRRLQQSNVTKTPEGIREVIGRVSVLRDAWREMLCKEPAAAAVPA